MATRRQTSAKRELLREDLTAAFRSGTLAPGQMVPTLSELTARYGLSSGVVHQEIKRLSEEGLLYSVPRVGTFVAPAPGPAEVKPCTVATGEVRDTVAVLSPSALLSPPLRHPSGWSTAIDSGTAQALHSKGYHVLSLHSFCFLGDTLAQESLERLASKHLFGLIITDTEGIGEPLRAAFHGQHLPVVALDNQPKLGACDRVVSDHEAGAYELTRWLIERGRRRILNLWAEPADGYWFSLRRRGYERAMQDAGLASMKTVVAPYAGPDSQEDFEGLARRLAGHLIEHLSGPDPVDALMLASDGHTPLTAAAIRLFGLEPNREVLLAGYDNYWENMPFREYDTTAPAVTMDKQNWEIGQEAARLLLERGQGRLPRTHQQRIVTPQLVEVEYEEQNARPPRRPLNNFLPT